jgi:hypothetical protein
MFENCIRREIKNPRRKTARGFFAVSLSIRPNGLPGLKTGKGVRGFALPLPSKPPLLTAKGNTGMLL